MILRVLGPPRGSLEEGTENDLKKLIQGPPFWDPILEHFGSQICFLCILFVLICMLIFGSAFGRPPVPILRIQESFQGAFWSHFGDFFAVAAKRKKCNHFRRNACFGRCWASGFALFLLTFCMCFLCCFLDTLFVGFWRIWASKGGPLGGNFHRFCKFCMQK